MMMFILGLVAVAQASPVVFFDDLDNFTNKNLNLQTERQNLKASSDLLLSRRLFWTPKLSVSADHNETRLNTVKIYDVDSLNANLNLNLFRGGFDWNKLKDAEAQKTAQELQVLNESLRVEIKASDLIFKFLYLSESQHIQEKLLKLKEESLKIVTDRYHQGKLPLQEVTKSEVDLIQQKNRLRSANLDYIENKTLISSLFIEEIKTLAWPFSESTVPKLPANSPIPLVEQKYWSSQSLAENWKATKGLHWPSLDFTLQYQVSPIKERTNKQWIGLLSLSFPLWNQFETVASVSSSFAQYVRALNDYKDTEQSLNQRNVFLKVKIETARMNLAESKKNLETAKKLYEDILRSFRLGRISTNDLFLEQNRLLETETTLAISQLTFHQSLIETCALSGIKTSECL